MENIIKKFLGVKYRWWFDGDSIDSKGPFYYENAPCPSLDIINIEGINCAGFINLVARDSNVDLPLEGGGTDGWFKKLSKENKLEKIDVNKVYPKYTLLLRDYTNENDQGHLAFTYNENILNESKIVHAYSKSEINRNLNLPGVIIEDFKISHHWFNGTYTHVCYPKDWLKK